MATFPPPVVPGFLAGVAPLQPSDFTNEWQNPLAFLQNRIVFRGRQATTTTSLGTASAAITIPLDTVDEDPYSGWSASTHSWTPPAGYSGWYQVCNTLNTATPAATNALRVLMGGFWNFHLATSNPPSAHPAGVEGEFTVYLIGGQDSVTIQGTLLNATVAVSTSDVAGQQSSMDITWLGLG